MTTITTTEIRRSTPHRTRRYVIAALATAALLAPTAVLVSRINDNDAHQGAAAKTNPVVDPSPAVSSSASLQLVVNGPSFEACANGFADACPSAQTWTPAGFENLDVITDACAGGFADACVTAAQIRGS